MSNILEPGKYVGTVEDFGIRVSKEKKTPSLNIKFAVKDMGKSVFWEKYLTDGTMSFVMDTLVDSELLNTKKFSDLAKGKDGGGLKLNQEVELAVVHESYTDKDGNDKVAVKVEFINPIGGGAMKGALAEDEAIMALQGLNLDAAILQAEAKSGKTITVETQTASEPATAAQGATVDESEIPF